MADIFPADVLYALLDYRYGRAADVNALKIGQQAGVIAYATRALLDADLAHAANTPAIVTNDADGTNNTFYLKTGASGAGSWTKSAWVPKLVVPVSEYASLTDAVAAIGAVTKTTLAINIPTICTAHTVVTDNIQLMYLIGGAINHGVYNLDIYSPVLPVLHHVYIGSGTVSFGIDVELSAPPYTNDVNTTKKLPFIYPEMFGADASNNPAIDSHDAIVKASQASPNVIFQGGIYYSSPLLTSDWGARWKGNGAGVIPGSAPYIEPTIIRAFGTQATVLNIQGHEINAEGIVFDGNLTATNVLLVRSSSSNFHFKKCAFIRAVPYPATGNLIALGQAGDNIQVGDNSSFEECLIQQSVDDSTRSTHAIYAVNSNTLNIDFIRCYISSAHELVRQYGATLRFYNCIFNKKTTYAIVLQGLSGLVADYCYTEAITEEGSSAAFLLQTDAADVNNTIQVVLTNNRLNQAGASVSLSPLTQNILVGNTLGASVTIQSATGLTYVKKMYAAANTFILEGESFAYAGGLGHAPLISFGNYLANAVPFPDRNYDYYAEALYEFAAPSTVPGETAHNVTVTGAAVGDKVEVRMDIATPPPAGFTFYAAVTAANTVTLKWTQISGAAAQPTPGPVYYLIYVTAR